MIDRNSEFIANNVTASVREMIGILISDCQARLENTNPTTQSVAEVIRNLQSKKTIGLLREGNCSLLCTLLKILKQYYKISVTI